MKYLIPNRKKQLIKLLLIGLIMVSGINGIGLINAKGQEEVQKKVSLEISKEFFDTRCAACHGVEGKGKKAINPKIPNFTSASWQFSKTDEELFVAIENGKGIGRGTMPKWKGLIKPEEMKALVIYIRAFPAKANQLESADNLYLNYCSACHSKTGKGKKRFRPIPNFRNLSWQNSRSDQQLYFSISNGFNNNPNLKHAWNSILADNQINSLVTYVRGFSNK